RRALARILGAARWRPGTAKFPPLRTDPPGNSGLFVCHANNPSPAAPTRSSDGNSSFRQPREPPGRGKFQHFRSGSPVGHDCAPPRGGIVPQARGAPLMLEIAPFPAPLAEPGGAPLAGSEAAMAAWAAAMRAVGTRDAGRET